MTLNTLRLQQIAKEYTKNSSEPSDQLFCEHINAIASHPIGSRQYQRAINKLFAFLLKLPYGADKAFRGSKYEHRIKDEYQSLLLYQVINEAFSRLWTEFNPTGASFTGCFIHWVNFKLRLKYEVIDFYNKSKREVADQCHIPDLDEALTLSDLNQVIKFDQEQYNQTEKELGDLFDNFAEDVERFKFWHENYLMNDLRCTYQLLATRILLEGENKQAIVDEFDFNYNSFYAQYKRYFLPAVIGRLIEKGLLSSDLLDAARDAIISDRSLEKPIYKKYPALTPKFIAEKRFPMFCYPPLTLAEIHTQIKAQDPRTYKALNLSQFSEIYHKKCLPKIVKVIQEIL